MRLGAIVVVLLSVAPAVADKQVEPPPAAAVLDAPDHALDPFLAALWASEHGLAFRPVRISFLGDSLTADDRIADRMRQVLGQRFGDGGPGYVPAVALPHGRNKSIKRVAGKAWTALGVANAQPSDRLLGFAGATAETKRGGTITIKSLTRTTLSAEVYYLSQPGGGDVVVELDGKQATTIKTAGKGKKAGFARVVSTTPFRKVVLRASGKVRLFGVNLEGATGIVVDNLGVKNATAKGWNKNRRDHWRGQIAHRAPDLFVVMIGSNEAGWLTGKSLTSYRKVMDELLAPVQAAGAPCLVIAPLDQVDYRDDDLPQRKTIEPMVEAQRAAATAAGCAFWDAYQWMGGARSSLAWFKKRWMTNDFAHPTAAGDRRIADALAAGILDAYAAY